MKDLKEKQQMLVSEMFGMAIEAVDAWIADDEFLINAGSMEEDDVAEETTDGRNDLLKILREAKLPSVKVDIELQADDLPEILPAIESVLRDYSVKGISQKQAKDYSEAMKKAFSEVCFDTPSEVVQSRIKRLLVELDIK